MYIHIYSIYSTRYTVKYVAKDDSQLGPPLLNYRPPSPKRELFEKDFVLYHCRTGTVDTVRTQNSPIQQRADISLKVRLSLGAGVIHK
jgi:hypothetical protein